MKPVKYRINKTNRDVIFRYAVEVSYGGSFIKVDTTVTVWGGKRVIKRLKRAETNTIVYETD